MTTITTTYTISNRMGDLPADMQVIAAADVQPGMTIVALPDHCENGIVLESPGYEATVKDTGRMADGSVRIRFHGSESGWYDTVNAGEPVGVVI